MAEFNLYESLLLLWIPKEAGAMLSTKVAGKDNGLTTPAATAYTDLTEASAFGILTVSPTLEAVRLRAPHNRRRGRVVRGSGGAGTWQLQVIRDTDADGVATFLEKVESSPLGRFQWCLQPFRRDLLPDAEDDEDDDVFALGKATIAATADNPLYQGSCVLTSLDLWGPGGQDPAVMQAGAELDADYAVHRS